MKHILVTGANGFLGHAITSTLCSNFYVRAAIRISDTNFPDGVSIVDGSMDIGRDWSVALADVSVIIHCAARVHVMNELSNDPLVEFRRVNVDGTVALARQSALAGVRRFIFISSIGVNGAETVNRPFSPNDIPAPHSPYAISKWEAEQKLSVIAAETGMELVIIRPPMVYGPDAPGNFKQLMKILSLRIPLPLGAISNRRSFIGIDNLVEFVNVCIDHPAAANQTFLVSDGEDISTTVLLRRIGLALEKPARLISVPQRLLSLGTSLIGRNDLAQRLFSSLEVDITKTRTLLGWTPPISVDEGLRRAAAHWLATHPTSKTLL